MQGQALLCQLGPQRCCCSPRWQRGACLSFSSNPNLCVCFSFADVLCLLYDFSIISPARPGQPWYKIEGQINGNTFVYYDSQSKELKPVGHLGLQLKDIPFWERQKETLEDSCNELKTKPLEITAETSSNRGKSERPRAEGEQFGRARELLCSCKT